MKTLIGSLGLLVVSCGVILTFDPTYHILAVIVITLGNFITFLSGKINEK
jgi:hypothetical protein